MSRLKKVRHFSKEEWEAHYWEGKPSPERKYTLIPVKIDGITHEFYSTQECVFKNIKTECKTALNTILHSDEEREKPSEYSEYDRDALTDENVADLSKLLKLNMCGLCASTKVSSYRHRCFSEDPESTFMEENYRLVRCLPSGGDYYKLDAQKLMHSVYPIEKTMLGITEFDVYSFQIHQDILSEQQRGLCEWVKAGLLIWFKGSGEEDSYLYSMCLFSSFRGMGFGKRMVKMVYDYLVPAGKTMTPHRITINNTIEDCDTLRLAPHDLFEGTTMTSAAQYIFEKEWFRRIRLVLVAASIDEEAFSLEDIAIRSKVAEEDVRYTLSQTTFYVNSFNPVMLGDFAGPPPVAVELQ